MGEYYEEIDRELSVDPDGITTYDDQGAINERINEWFDTQEGALLGKPWWGSPIYRLKYEPISDNLNVLVEMVITEKLPRDVAGASVRSVTISYVEIDRFVVTINVPTGVFSREVSL